MKFVEQATSRACYTSAYCFGISLERCGDYVED